MIKAIIFDFGGVYVDNTESNIILYIADNFNIDFETVVRSIEKFKRDYEKGQLSDFDFWKLFSQDIGKKFPKNYKTLWTGGYPKERKKLKIVSLVK